MKEKRYFCDFVFGTPDKKTMRITTLIIFLSLLVIIPIAIFYYNAYTSKHEYALNSYSASAYEYLEEIANNVITEEVGINLLAIPNDVVKYEISHEDNEIIFKYYLDNNKDIEFAPSATMTIKLSNNFNIISKEPNYSSEEEYVKSVKSSITFLSVGYGFISWVVIWIILLIVMLIGGFVSQARKYKNLS